MGKIHAVYLAYYHTGFTDDPPQILGAYKSAEDANAVLEVHKHNRDRGYEYKNRASWWTSFVGIYPARQEHEQNKEEKKCGGNEQNRLLDKS